MRAANRLTALKIARLKEPGRYADGGGLYLQIADGGSKAWLLRYMRNRRSRQMGLGSVQLVSLAEAREKALAARKLLLDGVDPIDARHADRAQARVEAARGISFQQCGERYIAAHEASWKSPKHRAQWKSTLATYAYPVIGKLPVSTIETGLVLKCIESIWSEKVETAGRVRGRIELILDWARVRGYRSGENPARWRGHLDKLLPARSKVSRVMHHAALPYGELPAFMATLRDRADIGSRALEFTILTASRTTETILGRWPEVELSAKVWTVPPERMKGGREHKVPLSDRATEILRKIPREADYLFPGARAGMPLSNMTMLELLRGLRAGLTVHGFRSTFRDWAAETTNHANEVVEMALAHVVSDRVEAAYRRGDLFEKRRRLMADWAHYCAAPSGEIARVVPISGRRAAS